MGKEATAWYVLVLNLFVRCKKTQLVVLGLVNLNFTIFYSKTDQFHFSPFTL